MGFLRHARRVPPPSGRQARLATVTIFALSPLSAAAQAAPVIVRPKLGRSPSNGLVIA